MKISKFFHSEFGFEIEDEEKAKTMMEKLDAMNKDMFDAYVDGNGDGSATLQEIEMVSLNSYPKNFPVFRFVTFVLGRILHVPCNCPNDDQNDG